MCYWVGTRKVRETILKHLKENPDDEIAQLYYETFLKPKSSLELFEHNVAIGKGKPKLNTLIKENGLLKFRNLEWTLRWTYFDSKTGTEKEGRPLLNSTSEKIFWQHKDLIYSRRCVIPVDGYWEFYHYQGKTYPHFIYPKNGDLFYLGGIYNELADPKMGEVFETFSVITTAPNNIAKKLHNNQKAPNGPRMILIMDYSQINEFLDESLSRDYLKNTFLKPYADDKMNSHPTVRFLKKEYSDYLESVKVQEKFVYPELVA